MMIRFHKDGEFSFNGERSGFWTRHENGKVDRGVRLGDWQGCWFGGVDSPRFQKRSDLVGWLMAKKEADK